MQVACGADEDSSRMLAVTSPGRLEGQRASANRPGAPVPRDQEQAPRLAKHLFASGARRRSRSPRVKAAGGLNDDALRGCSRSFSSACAAGCANCCRSWVALFALALVWLYVMWAALGHGWDALAGALHESAASGTKWVLPSAAHVCRVAEKCARHAGSCVLGALFWLHVRFICVIVRTPHVGCVQDAEARRPVRRR